MKLWYLLVYRIWLGWCSRSKKGMHLIPNRLHTDWAREQTLQELVGCCSSGGDRHQLGNKTEANHRLISDAEDRSRWHASTGFEGGRHVMHACGDEE
jgi:hypothetical protein